MGMVNIGDYFPWMGWFNKLNGVEVRLDKKFRKLDSFYDRAIQEHRECQSRSGPDEHEDLVDVLLRIQTDPNQEIGLTDDQIKAVLTRGQSLSVGFILLCIFCTLIVNSLLSQSLLPTIVELANDRHWRI
ncbi:hypothetical protein POM88_046594 [Heracleum sosnowskyi]|uniref:Cytochrome P450 n=1 Tax=Heracleum sosnowskyi TaxID=360622 RepID=A0AAD8H785_9APIA|nr:hypothetical protein POM88_046594 [Heracleum sosnowskyi]